MATKKQEFLIVGNNGRIDREASLANAERMTDLCIAKETVIAECVNGIFDLHRGECISQSAIVSMAFGLIGQAMPSLNSLSFFPELSKDILEHIKNEIANGTLGCKKGAGNGTFRVCDQE